MFRLQTRLRENEPELNHQAPALSEGSPNSLIFSQSLTRPLTFTHTRTTTPAPTSRAQPSPAMTPTRRSPAIDSSPPRSLYRQPIPIGSLSLTTRSFLPLSPYHPHTHSFFHTIPIPIPILLMLETWTTAQST